jgi:cysteine desulfurase
MQFLFSKNKPIYLDHAAATPMSDRALEAFVRGSKIYANASALHEPGLEAKKILSTARKSIATILHAQSEEIIFTSGGTESDVLALTGVVRAARTCGITHPQIIISAVEHPALLETARALEHEGVIVHYVAPDTEGIIHPESIRELLTENTVLVSVLYVQNEIGTIQPIRDIAKMLRHYRKETRHVTHDAVAYPYFHTDACQAGNYLSLNREELGVDMMTINGSKLYAGKGVGALYVKRGIALAPLMYGGNQEFGLRAGTEPVALISSFAEGLLEATELATTENARLTKLRDYFVATLSTIFPTIRFNGSLTSRIANNVNISISGITSEILVLGLAAEGIAVSGKSACKSDDPDESYVIRAIGGTPEDEVWGSVRFSLGRSTTRRDLDRTILALKKIIQRQAKAPKVRPMCLRKKQ